MTRGVIRVLLPMIALAAFALGCAKADKAAVVEAVPVRVGTVEQKAVPVELRNVGTVQPYNTVAVRALVNGEILQVHFREGQDVRALDAALAGLDAVLQVEGGDAARTGYRDDVAAVSRR
jgi:multidrug efflux system membrane fusion protein